tara:strand:+ start:133 stop:405 length:273 start_codon:yes stop_codon:yes gene_type:complete
MDNMNSADEIFNRIEVAINGQRNTDRWSEHEINSSAPEGMDYLDWIEEACNVASHDINKLKAALKEISELASVEQDECNGIAAQALKAVK